MARLFALTFLLMFGGGPAQADGSDLQHCLLMAVGDQAIAECVKVYHANTTPDAVVGSDTSNDSDLTVYKAIWLPACPLARPETPGSTDVSCLQAHSCPYASMIQAALWLRQTRAANGDPVAGSWAIDHFECRAATDLGVVRPQLTWGDVLSAVRRVGIPPSEVHAPRYTLVNLETTFYTEPQRVHKTLQIIGYTVEISIEPVGYTWHWGDGSTQTTDEPGRPYPAKDVTHTYSHAMDPDTSLTLSVDVTDEARYRVDGGPWIEVPDSITIPGPPTALPVKQASAVLVTDD